MTASNGGIPSDEIKNYFNSIQSPFPVVVDGKIDTQQFLEASRGVVSLVGKFNLNGPVSNIILIILRTITKINTLAYVI